MPKFLEVTDKAAARAVIGAASASDVTDIPDLIAEAAGEAITFAMFQIGV